MKVLIYTWESYEDLDEMYDKMNHTESNKNKKRKREKQNKQNNNEKDLHQSQRMPAGWREGDSHIGRAKKERNYNN